MVFGIKNKVSTVLSVATLALLSSANLASAQEGFKEVETDFGDAKPTGVVLPSICIGDFTVAKAMYTFEPAEKDETEVKILTNPENLVETGFDGDTGLIYFKFLLDVAESTEDAGVVIKFPADQLETVNSCCKQEVQIKGGFTNFKELTVSTGAMVNASIAEEQKDDFAIYVYENATVNAEVKASSGSRVVVIADDDATANIKGDITAITCAGSSTCKIAGSINEPNESEAVGKSSIRAASCEGVTVESESTCQSRSVNVRVRTNSPLIISGVKEDCVGGEDLGGPNGLARPTGMPTVSAAPTATPSPTVTPTADPTPSPTAPPADPPEDSSTTQGTFASVVLGTAVMLMMLLNQ